MDSNPAWAWTRARASVTVARPMLHRSAHFDVVVMPASAGRTSFGGGSVRVLVNGQPTGA
jgi:hypothetical protein